MVRRISLVLVASLLLLLMAVAVASASGEVTASGVGQTPLSASLGFNAKSDLSGSLEYNADPQGPNAGFRGHCNDYDGFRYRDGGADNQRVDVIATCTDQDGNTVYLRGQFVDRGEPGTDDWLCIGWSYVSYFGPYFIHDMGVIQNGNIQIKQH